jgi:poly-gamma-glutamate synthesis protein (capsule biosynthesis protein)
VSVVSLANNHAWDYGPGAFFESLRHLAEAGVHVAGASLKPGEAGEPVVTRVRGWSVAWLAVTDLWNQGERGVALAGPHIAFAHAARSAERVARARAEHDIVLVSYHGGKEYSEHVAPEARVVGSAVLAAGADAVIGHHPHVPQGVEWFGRQPLLYSLGNLVFGPHRGHPWTGRGFLARLTFRDAAAPSRRAALELELCPYRIVDGVPRLVGRADFGAFHRHQLRLNTVAGFSRTAPPDALGCMRIVPLAS